MVLRIFFGLVFVLIAGACNDFELKKMGGLGEPCFENGLCEGGLMCVAGTCVSPTGDGDTPSIDEDTLSGEEEETDDTSEIDEDEPEGDVDDVSDTIMDEETLSFDQDTIDTDVSDVDTVVPWCGNGILEGNEECDDNNTDDGDGCSHVCTIEPAAPIIDMTVLYGGTLDQVLLQWTAPGPQDYCYDSYRICVDETCNTLTKTAAPGTKEEHTIFIPWYSGTHTVTVQPMRDATVSGNEASLQVDTSAQVAISPTAVDFGTVPYNSSQEATVSVDNASPVVDLVINQIYLPMDCEGKVSIVSGSVDPTNKVTLRPGESHAVLLRYAPTAVSSCGSGDRLTIQWITYGSPYYESQDVPIMGTAINSPPVITKIEFTKNPVKANAGTTEVIIVVRDENNVCGSITDTVDYRWDRRELGGGPREFLPNPTCISDPHEIKYSDTITVSALSNGIYVLPITVTDSAGNTAQANATFAVYSGKILEVGAGKPHTSIMAALPNYSEGDVVVVYPGTYGGTANSGITGNGKNLFIYGIAGPRETIIDLSGLSDTVAFNMSGGQSTSIVGGFAVRGGSSRAAMVIGQPNPENLLLTDCLFENNANNNNGGALFVDGDKARLAVRHSQFINNSVPAPYWGGAIYAQNGAQVTLFDVSFSGNEARMGGAIAVSSNMIDLQIEKSVFWGNRASVGGGALHAFVDKGAIGIVNSIFAENWSGGDGGALSFGGSSGVTTASFSIYNSTIVENESTHEGGGIIVTAAGMFSLKDSIVFFNQAANGLVSQLKVFDDGSGSPEVATATVSFCTIGGAPNSVGDDAKRINAPNGFVAGQQGNMVDDPQFLGTGNGIERYRLSPSSPCIDTSSDDMATVPEFDFLGYSRVNISAKGDGVGDEADRGALEYIP